MSDIISAIASDMMRPAPPHPAVNIGFISPRESEEASVKETRSLIIAVDFDGVLNAREYPHVGATVAGAVAAMKELKKQGHHLIIWTCREGHDQTVAVNWLLEKGIPFDGINQNARKNIEEHSNDSRKVFADLYIDDRQVGGFPGWQSVLEYVDLVTSDE